MGRGSVRSPARLIMPDVQRGDQFGTALHADLAEHGLEVILDRERRDADAEAICLVLRPWAANTVISRSRGVSP